jgi:hypothetical protein
MAPLFLAFENADVGLRGAAVARYADGNELPTISSKLIGLLIAPPYPTA